MLRPALDPNNAPVLIGPGNAVEATGVPWHWWRRHAAELGVRVIAIGSKRVIIASELVEAISKRATPTEELPLVDELAAMRERIQRAG